MEGEGEGEAVEAVVVEGEGEGEGEGEEEFDESTPEGQLQSSLSELQAAEELIKDPSTWEIYPGANTTEE